MPHMAAYGWECVATLNCAFGRIKSHSSIKDSPMRTTQQFSITLPIEMAAQVRAKVAAGEYASESEVIRDGLRALQAREKAVESWLRNEIAPVYDALKSDPARGRSINDVKATLAAEHDNAIKTR
jgi:antitoxin ParD1/3/4